MTWIYATCFVVVFAVVSLWVFWEFCDDDDD